MGKHIKYTESEFSRLVAISDPASEWIQAISAFLLPELPEYAAKIALVNTMEGEVESCDYMSTTFIQNEKSMTVIPGQQRDGY